MAVPDYQSLMLPLLEALSDGRDHDVNSYEVKRVDTDYFFDE